MNANVRVAEHGKKISSETRKNENSILFNVKNDMFRKKISKILSNKKA